MSVRVLCTKVGLNVPCYLSCKRNLSATCLRHVVTKHPVSLSRPRRRCETLGSWPSGGRQLVVDSTQSLSYAVKVVNNDVLWSVLGACATATCLLVDVQWQLLQTASRGLNRLQAINLACTIPGCVVILPQQGQIDHVLRACSGI